ncbi:ribose-5-phosphate isomerase B [Raoultella ornithinolytica]|nr:ribose-5-phosphate isomerase B [Raoultella ornithinolytica]
MKRIAIGCDHVGFILKNDIVAHLRQRGIEVLDKGTWSPERTDYPRYASAVAQAILTGEAEGGILICGTGVGISITANKYPAFARWCAVNPIRPSYRGNIIIPMCWPSARA